MKKIFLLPFIFAISCADNKQLQISQELASKISEDQRMELVSSKAETLVQTGLNAGEGYGEVWIRDLNTFIELACQVGNTDTIRQALITFFKFQGEDGNIPDGYIPKKNATVPYDFGYSELAPELASHKNTVETDQETSLIQAIAKYIRVTNDRGILKEMVANKTVEQRMNDAMQFLMKERYNEKYGLIWGATTVDWGDVQPEQEWGVRLDDSSHISIDIYDNAMLLIAIRDFVSVTSNESDQQFWEKTAADISANIRKHLWDQENRKFIPHIYIDGSPFPSDFNEKAIHYHGGTAIAIEAGLLSKEDILTVYNQMQQNVKVAGAQSIGLTIYPVYPNGFFKNPSMREYGYQNGGDWTWFGGRMVQQLIANGFYEEAYEAISPMLDRVIKNDGFFEWYSREGKPSGSGQFRGSAGVLWKAIKMFRDRI